jgi:hypothetical protein
MVNDFTEPAVINSIIVLVKTYFGFEINISSLYVSIIREHLFDQKSNPMNSIPKVEAIVSSITKASFHSSWDMDDEGWGDVHNDIFIKDGSCSTLKNVEQELLLFLQDFVCGDIASSILKIEISRLLQTVNIVNYSIFQLSMRMPLR